MASKDPEVQRRNAQKPRPSRRKLTPELLQNALAAIRVGVRPEIAFALHGVPTRTYYDWMSQAREQDAHPLLHELLDGVEIALAEWEATDVMLIGQAARQENAGEWTAAAWRLERRLPSIYGKRSKVDVDATVSARPFIDQSKLSIEEQRQLLELLRKAAPAPEEELPSGGKAALELVAGPALE